jgi:hypothetical protein
MILLALMALSIHSDFEGGSLGKVERISTNHYRCEVAGQADQNSRNRQASWYYFRVDDARNRTITFDMVALAGEYNFQPNRGAITKDTLPFYSFDQKTWHPVMKAEFEASEPRLSFSVRSTSSTVWIAHVPPYTNRNLANLLRDLAGKPEGQVTSIGKTLQGRDIPLLTITDPSVPDSGKKVLWFMFRQHAWEAGSSWTGEGLIRFAMSADPAATQIRRGAILKILPMCDPDGVARGTVRFNVKGFDLNRNWDVSDPVNMPEITAERGAILDWVDTKGRIDAFVTVHNTETGESLMGPPDSTGTTRPLMERFFEVLSETKTFSPSVKPNFAPASTTAGMPGRMTAVQGLYRDRKLAAFEIEMRIALHPRLGHRPNVDDRLLSGSELLRALWTALRN